MPSFSARRAVRWHPFGKRGRLLGLWVDFGEEVARVDLKGRRKAFQHVDRWVRGPFLQLPQI